MDYPDPDYMYVVCISIDVIIFRVKWLEWKWSLSLLLNLMHTMNSKWLFVEPEVSTPIPTFV